MNTLGNWSDDRLLGTIDIPYVTSLPEFPSTAQTIFRDFPDVFSEEYHVQAERCAQALEKRKSDSLMIGYFLRNEHALYKLALKKENMRGFRCTALRCPGS